jgi:hypothetical protein
MRDEFIVLREAREGDVAFIFATALRNTWYSNQLQTTFSKDKYMKLKHFEIEKALDNHITLVATLSNDEDVILGYAINTPQIYTYVKKAWRTAGIEQMLHDALNRYNKKEIEQ